MYIQRLTYGHVVIMQRGLGERCRGLLVGGEELSAEVKLASGNLPYATVMASKGTYAKRDKL